MRDYRFYSRDGQGNISQAEWFEADDDSQAVSKARQMKPKLKREVWQRDRLVAELDPDGLAG